MATIVDSQAKMTTIVVKFLYGNFCRKIKGIEAGERTYAA